MRVTSKGQVTIPKDIRDKLRHRRGPEARSSSEARVARDRAAAPAATSPASANVWSAS